MNEDLKLKEDRLKLLNETCAHYKSTNRGTREGGRCSYEAGCAVGRLIEDKELCKRLDVLNNSAVSNYNTFGLLPKSLQYYGQNFLAHLQRLHDTPENWNETGLSEAGEREKRRVILFDV